MEVLLTKPGSFRCKTSSTQQPASQFASKNMFDGREDTCWNSEQGSPQFILLDFTRRVRVTGIKFAFQGGFAGAECTIDIGDDASSLQRLVDVPGLRDVNEEQSCTLDGQGQVMRISFPSSTDFYGRITLYKLEVFGSEL